MLVKQIKLSKMETFCYLVGDENTRTAVLIDPAFDTGRILGIAAEMAYTITHVINTHCHSDHTAGNHAIIRATKARLFIHKADAPKLTTIVNTAFSKVLGGKGSPLPDVLLQNDEDIAIGDTVLKTIHTPGHTPGSICLYAPGHVFTGDTLFVEAVGRTDMPGGSSRQLLQSIRERLYTLPGETVVWPGHDYGPTPKSSIDYEKQYNGFTR